MQVFGCVLYIALMGVLSHFIGEALPRGWFNAAAFPYAPYPFEKSGRLYAALRVRSWKDRLPDKSKFIPGMVKKSVAPTASSAQADRLVAETCVAEMVHFVLMLLAWPVWLICPNPAGAVIAVLYALSHIPFIIIQRYNRPTLILLAGRLRQREERNKHASTDTVSKHR